MAREVMLLLSRGLTNRQILDELSISERRASTPASRGSAIPERWFEDPGSPDLRVIRPEHRVVVRTLDQHLFANVERPGHHVAGLLRYQRVAAGEEAL